MFDELLTTWTTSPAASVHDAGYAHHTDILLQLRCGGGCGHQLAAGPTRNNPADNGAAVDGVVAHEVDEARPKRVLAPPTVVRDIAVHLVVTIRAQSWCARHNQFVSTAKILDSDCCLSTATRVLSVSRGR